MKHLGRFCALFSLLVMLSFVALSVIGVVEGDTVDERAIHFTLMLISCGVAAASLTALFALND